MCRVTKKIVSKYDAKIELYLIVLLVCELQKKSFFLVKNGVFKQKRTYI